MTYSDNLTDGNVYTTSDNLNLGYHEPEVDEFNNFYDIGHCPECGRTNCNHDVPLFDRSYV